MVVCENDTIIDQNSIKAERTGFDEPGDSEPMISVPSSQSKLLYNSSLTEVLKVTTVSFALMIGMNSYWNVLLARYTNIWFTYQPSSFV